ncbi:glycosyltransferase [Vibrio sp. JCM 19236]|nr:glycosyltransferase [Vibrio sp. JCM 19236]
MKKIKILYVVSTLARSGPTNQLLNIIRNLDSESFEPTVLTLSPEPSDSLKSKYDELNIRIHSLGLSRIKGLLHSKSMLTDFIKKNKPSVIHTQGIRADSLLAKLDLDIPWLLTSRNYPYDDYPMKFGRFKGGLMARSHISAMLKCSNVVACSKTIASELGRHKINAKPIQNGVHTEAIDIASDKQLGEFESPLFVSVGSLIPRKNMAFLIEAFNHYSSENKGSLVILGGGPEEEMLKTLAQSDRIHIKGSVSNVRDYLGIADYFLSSSLSEGLPNTVLEGLSAGLPALLSDIPSHKEISDESPKCAVVFELSTGPVALSSQMSSIREVLPEQYRANAKKLANTVFSAASMSGNYQKLYKELVFKQHQ